jgi:hypothetical protein
MGGNGWRGAHNQLHKLNAGRPGSHVVKKTGAFFFFGLSAEIFGAIILLSRSALAVGLIRLTGRQDFEWLQDVPE